MLRIIDTETCGFAGDRWICPLLMSLTENRQSHEPLCVPIVLLVHRRWRFIASPKPWSPINRGLKM